MLFTSPITGLLMCNEAFQEIIRRIEGILTLVMTKGKARIVGSSLFFTIARDYIH